MARETWVQSQVESYQRLKKWYLMPPGLTPSIIKYGSRVKWSNPEKAVAPSPTPWCCSKGNLQATLDEGRQLYYLYNIYVEENRPLKTKFCNISAYILYILSRKSESSLLSLVGSTLCKDAVSVFYGPSWLGKGTFVGTCCYLILNKRS